MTSEELRVIESMQLHLRELSSDMAESVQAHVETAVRHVEVADSVRALVATVGQLVDQVRNLDDRLGKYIQEAARDRSGVRDVDKRLKVIEAANGQR